MGSIFSLREFTFEGNEVLTLPALLVQKCKKLTRRNALQLRTPPLEVLEHSTHAILEYLKRMQVARKTQALDLRALELRRTPVEVAFMTGLTSLSLENNKIQKLFAGLGCLTLLSELLLDYNELQTLPRTVANLTNLTKLSIAHNKIKHMGEWLLPRLPLRVLNATNNLIQELPFSLLKFTKMMSLKVDMNSFTDPPREVVVAGQKYIFHYLKALQDASTSNILDFSHLGLLNFPALHCDMTALTCLMLDYNLLQSLPAGIGKLLKLETLSVKDNKLTQLPLELGYLRRLKVLETAGNELNTPPPEVCKAGAQLAVTFLANVLHAAESRRVELKQMMLASVPEIVFQQTSITCLDLSENEITSLPLQLLLMTTLTELVLDKNQLKELPEDIGLLVNLQTFSLSQNHLLLLPQSIGEIQRLKFLRLEDNQLKELPPELGIMYSLEDVRVRNNPLKIPPPEVIKKGTRHFLDYLRRIVDLQRNNICDMAGTGLEDPELPEYILRMKFTQTLLLNDNNLLTLDISTTRLADLTLVDLSNNKLKTIPECIFVLTKLQTLRLGENDLQFVHADICKLKTLKHLSLKGNPSLEFLPPALGLVTSLVECDVSQCPLRGPPREVVNEGAKVLY
jgi:Leucine-rich repeat (LRR) protein